MSKLPALRAIVVVALASASIAITAPSHAQDEAAIDRCLDACAEAEDACIDACPDGPEGDPCFESCEDIASNCMDACESVD